MFVIFFVFPTGRNTSPVQKGMCVCVSVCRCGVCNVWVCVCVGFVMCGCVYVWVRVCLGFVMYVCVYVCVYVWVF